MIGRALALMSVALLAGAAPVRVLIVTDGGESGPQLRRILDSTGRFECRVNEEPSGLTSSMLSRYNVLVTYGSDVSKSAEAFVRNGGGSVTLHRDHGTRRLFDVK